jgi:thiol-disulfide isomerase/thioredoxin
MPGSALARILPAVGLAALIAVPAASAKVRKGDRAAELVQVKTQAGKAVRLKPLKDQVVVITFGASWCAPCKKELPALEKLARKYAGARAKVSFIAINIDTEPAKGKKFMKEAGLAKVIAAYDPRKTSVASFDPPTMPTTFVLRGGVVRHMHAGFRAGDENKLDRLIAAELKKL